MNKNEIKWRCDVCLKMRPDEFISVRSTDRSEEFDLPKGTMTENVKYCNDDESCIKLSKLPKVERLTKSKITKTG